MTLKTIICENLIRRTTKKNSLFLGDYVIDPYQNCGFRCSYCDSSFDNTIYVKINAPDVLEKELQTLPKGIIIIGSVHDPYQKAEETYELTKQLLTIIQKQGFPCHILTKSLFILQDLSLLKKCNKVNVTISLVSLNNKVSHIFEGTTPAPLERLKLVKKLNDNNIPAGVALIPVLPKIVESEFETIIQQAQQHHARYLLHKYLELKGDQKHVIFDLIQNHFPQFLSTYQQLYKSSYLPLKKYQNGINQQIKTLCKQYQIQTEIKTKKQKGK